MKTMNRGFRDSIVLHIVLYIVFVIIALATILSVDNYIFKRMTFINGLLSNETSKIHLNDRMKSKLQSVNNALLNYAYSNSFSEMDKYEKQIHEYINSISQIIFVLENGGEYSDHFHVNYEGLEFFNNTIKYEKTQKSKYNIQVLDLRAKLYDLDKMVIEYRNLIIDYILAMNSGSLDRLKSVIQKKKIATKSIEAFFERVNESSNRLYMEAGESENLIKNYKNDTIKSYRAVKFRVHSFTVIALLLSGILMCLRVLKIVKSRAVFSDELNRVNTNQEELIDKRTKELESEVAIRIQKEQESLDKAHFLMEVIESLSHPFYVIDVNTYEIILANNATYDVISGGGVKCYELAHHINVPCDGINHPCPLKHVMETGMPVLFEHIHTIKSGEKRYFEIHGYPIKDKDGKVVKMIEYSVDITAKKDAELALINLNLMLEEKVKERTKKLENEVNQRKIAEENITIRENYFRLLIANISDIIIIINKNKRITYVSPSVEHITGFSKEQLLGKSYEDLIHSRDRQFFEMWMKKVITNKEDSNVVEFRIQNRLGAWIHSEAIAKNMLDSDVINGIILNIRDVTVRKKAEEEVRKLALVMEQNPSSIIITDLDAKIEYVNPTFARITGYSMAEVVGKNPNILQTEDTPVEVFKDMWNTVKRGKVWTGEFVNKKKNGELYVEHAIIAPILNDRGEITNFLGMKENITELKQARAKAEDSSKAKSMFLANMSHEIRTPLNGLIGFIDLLQQTKLDSDQTDYLETIKYSANSLMGILNDVLDLSKIDSGMLEIENEEFDFGQSIINTSKTFYAKAYEKGIKIYTFIHPWIPTIMKGDALRLSQVLYNILGNAIKFTPESGVIKVCADLMSYTESHSTIRVSVIDNGVGIPAEKLKTIFDSFAQVDSSVTRKYGGTGLGLTISRNLLRLMNAEMSVESVDGEGSTFFFELELENVYLPQTEIQVGDSLMIYLYGKGDIYLTGLLEKYLQSLNAKYVHVDTIEEVADFSGACFIFNRESYSDEIVKEVLDNGARVVFISEEFISALKINLDDRVIELIRPFSGVQLYKAVTGAHISIKRKPAVQIREVVRFKGSILVAEDNPVNIKLMKSVLSRLGLKVYTVMDGRAALDVSVNNTYDLIFMDINMPEMDGISAARKIREAENSSHKARVPIVALTAHSFDDVDNNFDYTDFDAFLAKPVMSTDIEFVLKKYLESTIATESAREDFDYDAIVNDIGLDKEIIDDLVIGFIEESLQDIDSIKSMLERDDYKGLKSITHSVRGAAENLRLRTLAGILSDIEKSIRLKDNDDIIKELDRYEEELNFILNIVRDEG